MKVYQATAEIKATAIELELPPNKVKKLLITSGVLDYLETEQIQELLKQGKTMAEMQRLSLNLCVDGCECGYYHVAALFALWLTRLSYREQ